jgi:hypothetical protein
LVFSLPSHAEQDVEILRKKEKLEGCYPLTPDVDYVDGMLYIKYAKEKSEKVKIYISDELSLERDLKNPVDRVKLSKGAKVHELNS